MPEEAGDAGVLDTAAVMDFIQNNGQEADPAPDPVTPDVDPAPPAATEAEPTPIADPLGPDPDVSDLDPATAALVNRRVLELRQGLTKRTTELADANRILEAAGGDPEAVLEAFTFQQMLMDDSPEGAEARDRLYQALSAQRGTQPAAPEATPEATPDDPFSEYDLPPAIMEALNDARQLKAEFASIRATQEARDQAAAHQAYVNDIAEDLTAKLGEITAEYPDLADAEDDIVSLSYSTNGNLLEAMNLYRSIEARAQAKLIAGSANVPGGVVTPPAGGGHSTEPPEEFTDFKSLRGPVTEWLERATAEIN